MEILEIFGLDVTGWLSGLGVVGMAGIIVTYLRKRGYIQSVKFWAKKLEVITQKIGEALLETSDVFGAMDDAIKENGQLKENSVKDIIKEGKEAVMEWKDAMVTIKSKPKSKE